MAKKIVDSEVVFKNDFLSFETVTLSDGHQRYIVHVEDSVGFLIYVADQDAVVMVSQFRAPMARRGYVSGAKLGVIVESPAGHLKQTDVIKTIIEEIKEEIGADITKEQVRLLNGGVPLALSPGILSELMYLGYVVIRSDQLEKGDRVYGVKEEGEETERRFIPVHELASMIFYDMKTFALVQWFLREQKKMDEPSVDLGRQLEETFGVFWEQCMDEFTKRKAQK